MTWKICWEAVEVMIGSTVAIEVEEEVANTATAAAVVPAETIDSWMTCHSATRGFLMNFKDCKRYKKLSVFEIINPN